MTSRPLVLAFVTLAAVAPVLSAQAIPTLTTEVERLPDGRTLLTDAGNVSGTLPGIAFLVESDGTLVHSWMALTLWTHSAEWLGNGHILVTDTNGNRVVEVAADGTIVWDSDTVSPLSDSSHLNYPNDAELLANGRLLISDRDNHRVIELDRAGVVQWQFGITSVPGLSPVHLRQPHNPERLANGNTLIADSQNNRIVEVNPAGVMTWEYRPLAPNQLSWPRDADELPSGDVLITDSSNSRLVVVSRAGTVVRTIPAGNVPYEADYLPASDTYLIGGSGGGTAREVNVAGQIVWSYPPQRTVAVATPTVVNPTSGVNLFVHVHYPSDGGPTNRRPAVVFVPGGSASGQTFHLEAEGYARLGFVAAHFDPDGRGQSTNGGTYTIEDYAGFLHQDGLRQVVQTVAARPDVDPARIAIATRSYGITMAAGMLARYPDDPPVAVLEDWEGPASRIETAQANGGHVPVSPSNAAFWAQREAITFMPQVRCRYVRVQSEVDHVPGSHPVNFHAIDLANAALPPAFGGTGQAALSRVGTELENPGYYPWSLSDPPAWNSEVLAANPFFKHRLHLILQRALSMPDLAASGAFVPGSVATFTVDGRAARAGRIFGFAASFGRGPLALGLGWVNLDLDPLFTLTLQTGALDAAGQATLSYPIPNVPALAGLAFFAQSLVLQPGDPIPYHASACLPLAIH